MSFTVLFVWNSVFLLLDFSFSDIYIDENLLVG
jgi:hypothetical protein